MNQQFIQSLSIDWDKIERTSYLRKIEAIKELEELVFEKPITFFVGENGSGKSTLLEALAVAYGFNPEGGTKNYTFSTYDSHSELHEAIRLSKGFRRPSGDIFLGQKAFIMWQQKKWIMLMISIPLSDIMKNPMEKVFWRWHKTASGRMDCIF